MYKHMAKSCVERMTKKETSANRPSLPLEWNTIILDKNMYNHEGKYIEKRRFKLKKSII